MIAIGSILIAAGVIAIMVISMKAVAKDVRDSDKQAYNPSTTPLVFNSTHNPTTMHPTHASSKHPTITVVSKPAKAPDSSLVEFKEFNSGIDVMFKQYHSLGTAKRDKENDELSKALEIAVIVFLEDDEFHQFRLTLDDFSCWRYFAVNKHPFFCSISSVNENNWIREEQSAGTYTNKVYVPPKNELNFFHSEMASITQNFSLEVQLIFIEILCKDDSSVHWAYPLTKNLTHMRIDLFYYTPNNIASDPKKISIRVLPESGIFSLHAPFINFFLLFVHFLYYIFFAQKIL